jgi:hypothetical protein
MVTLEDHIEEIVLDVLYPACAHTLIVNKRQSIFDFEESEYCCG